MSRLYYLLLILVFMSPGLQADDQVDQLQQQVQQLLEQLQTVQADLRRLQGQQQAQQQAQQEVVEALEEDVSYIQETQDSMAQGEEQQTKVNLYTTLEYENFENSDSVFDAKNVELLFTANLGTRLHSMAEIEFERTAKTSGGSRSGEVEVEQGWIQYDIKPWLNPRAGVVLVPFGKYNLDHFDVMRDLTDRPIAMRRVIPVTWAEAGIGSVGGLPVANGQLDYHAYVINGLFDDISDRGFRNARGAFGRDNNNNKAFAGRLSYAGDRHELGLSVYQGKYNDSKDITGYDIDAEFHWGAIEVLGEYASFDLDAGLNADGVSVPENLEGGYLQANYHFWPQSLNDSFLGKNFAAPTFTWAVRYGWADNDDDGDVGSGANREKRWTTGLNYRPVETFVAKCEYQWNQTDNEALERGDANGVICSASSVF